jgi:hypothetical protein
VEHQPPISVEEVRGTFFVIGDIAEHVREIRRLLEEEDDGEAPEDDA